MRLIHALFLAPALLALTGCMKAPDPTGAFGEGSPDPHAGTNAPAEAPAARPAPKLEAHMEVPAGWVAVPPGMSFYLAKWEIPGEDPGVCTISYLGERSDLVESNIQRWIGQFEVEGGAEGVHRGTLEGAKRPTTTIVLKGTLTAVQQLGGGPPREGWMLAGAVVQGAHGPLYVKALAPAAVLEPRLEDLWKGVAGLDDGHGH